MKQSLCIHKKIIILKLTKYKKYPLIIRMGMETKRHSNGYNNILGCICKILEFQGIYQKNCPHTGNNYKIAVST